MKVELGSLVKEVPNSAPTPRVILKDGQVFLYDYDYKYKPVAFYDVDKDILVNANGSIVLDGSKSK